MTSFLASGNIIFTPNEQSPNAIADRAQILLRERIGFDEPSHIRSISTLVKLIAENPFRERPAGEIHSEFVTFLPTAGVSFPATPISSKRKDVVVFAIEHADSFSVTYMIGGRQGNATALLEQFTDAGLTTRNWKTVCRLVAKYG